ncbi:hypothetical protein T439DRAFT_346762 [Meredithblackwellia eburnea MCA 4105]
MLKGGRNKLDAVRLVVPWRFDRSGQPVRGAVEAVNPALHHTSNQQHKVGVFSEASVAPALRLPSSSSANKPIPLIPSHPIPSHPVPSCFFLPPENSLLIRPIVPSPPSRIHPPPSTIAPHTHPIPSSSFLHFHRQPTTLLGMSRPTRSQFIQKLHETLQRAEFPDDLRWTSHDTFEITVDDFRARQALSTSWDFRSLSSFIRQLSYYGFKRLSDRRRSVERRASAGSSFIVFAHPSGNFVKDDNSRLDQISRKTRARKPSNRDRKHSSESDYGHHDRSLEHIEEEHPRVSMYDHLASYRASQWAPPPPAPTHPRVKPSLSLQLSNDNPHEWQSRVSPYPTPVQQHSPTYPTSYYPNPTYFQYSGAPLPPVNYPINPSSRQLGAIVAPPSPSDSHSYGSGSPRLTESTTTDSRRSVATRLRFPNTLPQLMLLTTNTELAFSLVGLFFYIPSFVLYIATPCF